MRATQWPNQFPFNCKNSTQNAPKVVFLSSKIENIQSLPQWGGGHPLPTPYSPRCLDSKLAPSAIGPPAFPVSPPDLGVLAETLPANYFYTDR